MWKIFLRVDGIQVLDQNRKYFYQIQIKSKAQLPYISSKYSQNWNENDKIIRSYEVPFNEIKQIKDEQFLAMQL